MSLLNTVTLPNGLVAHGLNHLAVYNAAVIKVYAKMSATNSISDTGISYTLAGVKKLVMSENGAHVVAQTDTKTYLCTNGIVGVPLDVLGNFSVSNSGMIVLANAVSGSVQLITDITKNLTATVTAKDNVICGRTKFVVYSITRSLVCGYADVVLVSETHTKKLLYVAHVGSDEFAFFYSDGTIRCRGKTIQNTPALIYRNSGRHVIGSDAKFDYSYMRNAPQSKAVNLRTTDYVPPADIRLVKTITSNGITQSISFTSVNHLSTPNRFLLPTLPLQTLEQDLSVVTRTAMPDGSRPTFYGLSDTIFTNKAIDSTPCKTINAGATWTALRAKGYSGGVSFKHKNYFWLDNGSSWSECNTTDLSVRRNLALSPSGPQFTYDFFSHNDNCVVASTSTSASGSNIYVSWNFPAFNIYNIGITTNTTFEYVGMNIFHASSGSTSRLIYIPTTAGTPVILKTYAKKYDTITQIGGNIVVVDGAAIRNYPYDMIDNEATATLARATAYAEAITIALSRPTAFNRITGSQGYSAPWKEQNRLITGQSNGYQVWEFT